MNPQRLLPAALALALGIGAATPARAQTAESGTDSSIAPGDDFFAFANGAWLRATTIPAGRERWGARNEIDELTHRQLARILDDAAGAPAGSAARKVADYRAAWLDETRIDARGLAPLRPLLDSIAQVQDRPGLTRMLGRLTRADVDPLNWGIFQSASPLGLSVEPSIHGERTYVPFLVQGGLGLPDREDYLGTDAAKTARRAQYQSYIAQLLTLAGFDHADVRAAAVLALETALARTQATRAASANDHNADTVWTHEDFIREAPGLDWHVFFASAGVGRQATFVPWQPGAVRGLAALALSEPIETWKDYLRVRQLDALADVLPRPFADAAAAFHGSAPREERALAATQAALGEAIGRLYVERYFPAAQKERIQSIVANVRDEFVARVQAVTWLTPATKAQALAKLRTLTIGIGYPDRWQDDDDLAVDPRDALGNLRRARDRDYNRALARLGRPVDLGEWWIAPQTVGAILVFQQNAYDFAAALLQPPKFDPAASDAATYGAVGAIIGHDISHFVDVLGAEYDTVFAERPWWTDADRAGFRAAAAPLARQFDALGVNGQLTLTENVADLAGLSAAFTAYRRALGVGMNDRDLVRQHDREFFIAFARSWRTRISDGALRTQLASNDHAPEPFRVTTVRNLDAWYDAFDVRPGQRLYLEPAARVRVW